MSQETLPIRRIDHIRFYVSNARQAAYFYCHAMGFEDVGYAGLETGVRHESSHIIQQGDIRLVFTSPLKPGHPMAQFIADHGDAVQDICFEVEDVERAFAETTGRGAQIAFEPKTLTDDTGELHIAGIKTYGDTIHTFLNRDNYKGFFAPGYEKRAESTDGVGLLRVDHVVGNVGWGEMNDWAEFYGRVLGFSQLKHFDDKDISTEYSALMSKVMQSEGGTVKFPINEPAEGKRKSQIEEYLDFYGCPGVQHIALETSDICRTVRSIRERHGLNFLRVPKSYYDQLPERVGNIEESLHDLAELGILVDRDEEGYLLQLFSKPVTDRPTLFFEIIQRKGSQSFGKGNFKALFEAIEREQMVRGNL